MSTFFQKSILLVQYCYYNLSFVYIVQDIDGNIWPIKKYIPYPPPPTKKKKKKKKCKVKILLPPLQEATGKIEGEPTCIKIATYLHAQERGQNSKQKSSRPGVAGSSPRWSSRPGVIPFAPEQTELRLWTHKVIQFFQ